MNNLSKLTNLDKVLFIDFIAHSLHLESKAFLKEYGTSLYPTLDKLAETSTNLGETNRDDRLLILNKGNSDGLDKLNGVQIMTKSLDLEKGKSYWKLVVKSIKEGIKSLTDSELVTLREWLYART